MTPIIHVPPWAGTAVIWQRIDDQLTVHQVVGPQAARIVVDAEPELAPFDLAAQVHLVDGRYVVTRLDVHASALADQPIVLGDFLGDELDQSYFPSTTVPPITARGLAAIRLPAILQAALAPAVNVKRSFADGHEVLGMIDANDKLAATYCRARAVGDNPTRAVADELRIGHSAAAQRVSRARKAGIIPPVRDDELPRLADRTGRR